MRPAAKFRRSPSRRNRKYCRSLISPPNHLLQRRGIISCSSRAAAESRRDPRKRNQPASPREKKKCSWDQPQTIPSRSTRRSPPRSCARATLQSLFPSPPWCPASVTAFGEDSCAHGSADVPVLREGGHYSRPDRHQELAAPEMPGGPARLWSPKLRSCTRRPARRRYTLIAWYPTPDTNGLAVGLR